MSGGGSDEERRSLLNGGGRGGGREMASDDDAAPGGGRTLSRGASRYIEMQDIEAEVANSKFNADDSMRGKEAHGISSLGTGRDSMERLARMKRMAGFESSNYDPVDSSVEVEARRSRPHKDYQQKVLAEWLISGLIGICMGIIAFLVDWMIEFLVNLKYETTKSFIETGGFGTPYLVYMCFCGGYAAVAGSLVSFVEPLAAGSGIPELKTYLNGVNIKGLLDLRTLVAKLIGITFSIGSGLIAGKEGPFVHGGGIVGSGLGSMGSATLRWKAPGSIGGGMLRNEATHRDFTAIGTAAGVATAFAAPIGGILFTVEEGASFYSTSIFWRGFLSTCLGVLTLHWLVEYKLQPDRFFSVHMGIRRDFGLYEDDVARYGEHYWYYAWEIPVFVALGALGGLMGALFVRLNVRLTALRHRLIPIKSPIRRLLEVVVVALVTGTVFFIAAYGSPCKDLPAGHPDLYDAEAAGIDSQEEEFLSGGEEVVQGKPVFFDRLWCEEGRYSEFGQLFFAPLAQSLRLLLHLGETVGDLSFQYEYNISVLITFWVMSFVLMTWTYGVGAATGLFVPSLACGAGMGRVVGQMVHEITQAAGMTNPINLSTYAVLGAAASLGGATRMTLSITVLVMETTGSMQLITPLMVVIFVAKVVGDHFSHGIYDAHIKIRGAPLLEESDLDGMQKMAQDKLQVSEVMSEALVAFPPLPAVRAVVATLRSCPHGVFPVTPDPASALSTARPVELMGTIERKTLLKMLQHKLAFVDPAATGEDRAFKIPSSQAARLEILERLETIPFKPDEAACLRLLTEHDMNMLIDLRPLMQRHPYVVNETCSLSRAYRLFRTMGLHHILVAPAPQQVCGIITRKDVIEENLYLSLGEKQKGLPFIPFSPYDRSTSSPNAQDEETVSVVVASSGFSTSSQAARQVRGTSGV